MVDLDDLDVAVAPLRLDQRRAVGGAEIHDRGRQDGRQVHRSLCGQATRARRGGREGSPREHRRGRPHHMAPAVVGPLRLPDLDHVVEEGRLHFLEPVRRAVGDDHDVTRTELARLARPRMALPRSSSAPISLSAHRRAAGHQRR